MNTLQISCFGILLKHYLLRHYPDAVAPRGRMRREIDVALAGLPQEFQVTSEIASSSPLNVGMEEQHVTLQIDLQGDEARAQPLRLNIQGMLVRRGVDQKVHIMPCSIRLLADGTLTFLQIQQALRRLGEQPLQTSIDQQLRIGSVRFQPLEPSRSPVQANLRQPSFPQGWQAGRRVARKPLAASA